MLGAGKHQHLLPVAFADHLREQFPLALLVDEVHALRRSAQTRCCGAPLPLRSRVVQQLVGQRLDVVGEGRGEQQVLTLGRQLGQHAADVVDKAHVEHAVGFVQHQNFDLGQVNRVLVFQIQQTARRCHQDVDAAAQLHHLRVDADAAEHHQRTQVQVLAVGTHVFADLRGQFAGWRQDQRTHRATALGVRLVMLAQQLQQRQGKAGGFTGAGLGAGHQVTAFQHGRDSLLLDWGRLNDSPALRQRAEFPDLSQGNQMT